VSKSNFSNTDAFLGTITESKCPYRKDTTMWKQYCDQESVFEHIWNNADHDGFWDGSATTLAAVFRVSEDETHSALVDLADQGLIENVYPGKYAITNWRERDDPGEEELS
jgi:hypothetical protein